jgi:RND family efflux transporter MFP subunit
MRHELRLIPWALTALLVGAVPAAWAAPAISGTLQPGRSATLRAPTSGMVAAVTADVGQPVKRGAPVARVQDPTFDEAVGEARASVAAAVRAEEMAKASLADVQARAARRELLGSDVDRSRALLASTRDAVAQARSRLESVERAMAKLEVRAPFDGIIGERNVEPGDTVAADAAVATLMDTSTMVLAAAVAPDEVGALKVGQPVDVSVAGYAGTFRGTITEISPTVDPGTGQVQVTAEIPNPGRRLVSGVHAEARPVAKPAAPRR